MTEREPWFVDYQRCCDAGMVQTTLGCSGAPRVSYGPLTAPLHCPHTPPRSRRAALRARLASRGHGKGTL